MSKIRLKAALVMIPALLMAQPLYAAEAASQAVSVHKASNGLLSDSSKNTSPNPIANANASRADVCATGLMPAARHIFNAVSPKVEPDSNLKKLVKKEVKPKVFSGKLSAKDAKKSAQEATICLRILKHGDTNL